MHTPRFTKASTGTEVAEALKDEIQGKFVLITGASPQSLGEATAVAIGSAQPALLILASRTQSSLDAVARRVRENLASQPAPARDVTRVATVVLDLASQVSVRQAADHIRALAPRLDVLINNAGISVQRRQLSPEGIELTFATNHVGPFLLTSLLRPLLQRARDHGSPARVVNLSSSGHRLSPLRLSDYNFEGKEVPPEERPAKRAPGWALETVDGFPGLIAYGMSKSAAVLFTVAIRRVYGFESFAVDPGTIRTGLMREIAPGFRKFLEAAPADVWKSPDQACATVLVAAFDPSLSGQDGMYLQDCRFSKPASFASDATTADKLWKLSERLISLPLEPSKL